jgi:opacity protein-like surface antigen
MTSFRNLAPLVMTLTLATVVGLGANRTCEAAEISIAAGVDVGGEFEVSSDSASVSLDSETGFSLDLKVLQPVTGSLKLGGGIDVHAPRSPEDSQDDVQMISGFFEASWHPSVRSPFHLFGRVGYSTWNLDIGNVDVDLETDLNESGGLYVAAGAAYQITDSVGVELLYQRLSGELEYTERLSEETYSDDIDYSVVSARLRYRF